VDTPVPTSVPAHTAVSEDAAWLLTILADATGFAPVARAMTNESDGAIPFADKAAALDASRDDTPVTAESPWPAGPDPLQPDALAQLCTAMLADTSYGASGRGTSVYTTPDPANRNGVSVKRLTDLLLDRELCSRDEAKLLAQTLLYWFDSAGLLAAPVRQETPFRRARCLRLHEPAAIAARLAAVAPPARDAVRAAFAAEARSRPA